MLMIPRKNDYDVWDDMFKDPFFTRSNENKLMKTDIKETDTSYILDIDLPGFEKENIKMSIEDGYLTVEASTSKENEKKGNFIRKERFYGECSRSFYVGEDIKEDMIKASFKNGILNVEVPKIDEKEKEKEKKFITIE